MPSVLRVWATCRITTCPTWAAAIRQFKFYGAIFKAKLGSIDLTSVTGYNITNRRNSLDFNFSSSVAPMQTGTGLFFYVPTRTFTQELRLAGSIGPIDWLAGGFYKDDREKYRYTINTLNVTPAYNLQTTYDFYDPRSDSEVAGFADVTFHVTERFDIQVGARESHDNLTLSQSIATSPGSPATLSPEQATGTNAFTYLFTPRLKISPEMMVYARLASGYRPGGANTPGAVALGAPAAFAPDKTQDYELGFKGDFFARRFSLDASVYYINWQNLQIQLYPPDNHQDGYFANGGRAKSEGVELSAQVRPGAGLTVSGWINYDNAVLTQDMPSTSTVLAFSGDRLPLSSRSSANLSLNEEFPLWPGANGFVGAAVSRVGNTTRALSPKARVMGVEPTLANDAAESLRTGTIQTLRATPDTLADGVMSSRVGDITFKYLKQLDGFFLVDEETIRYWTQWLNHMLKVRIEPSSAMVMGGVTQLLATQSGPRKLLVILSGGNIDQAKAMKIWQHDGLSRIPSVKMEQ